MPVLLLAYHIPGGTLDTKYKQSVSAMFISKVHKYPMSVAVN